MRRLSGILLRVALALPMAYGAWSLGQFMTNLVAYSGYVIVPGLVLGCVLVLTGLKARWPWCIVAASGLWLAYLFVSSYRFFGLGYLLRHLPAPVVVGVYAIILALAFILSGQEDTTEEVHGSVR
jgi:hypothetical protein